MTVENRAGAGAGEVMASNPSSEWTWIKHLFRLHTWQVSYQHNGPPHRRCVVCHRFQVGKWKRNGFDLEWSDVK